MFFQQKHLEEENYKTIDLVFTKKYLSTLNLLADKFLSSDLHS